MVSDPSAAKVASGSAHGALVGQAGRDRLSGGGLIALRCHDVQTSRPTACPTTPRSPFYDEAVLRRGIGIRFKGVERTNVEEYCVSEGWVRVAVGKTLDRRGNPLTMKANGPVEPYFRNTSTDEV